MQHNRVLTTGEIAKHCGVNFRTVIRWIEKGYLSAYRLPGRGDNRIKLSHFLKFLQEYGMPIPDEFQSHQRRVLVVESDEAMASVLAHALEQHGFEVRTAHDGLQAGIILGTFQPAVLTVDVKMASLKPFDVLGTVRKEEELERLKVLVVAGLSKNEVKKVKEGGADAVMGKPVELPEYVTTVAELAGVDLPEVKDLQPSRV